MNIMNRITSLISVIMAVCAVLTTFTACHDDDNGVTADETLTIVRSNLVFEPQAATGSVEVLAEGPVVAELNSNWCTASVSHNVVTVSVAANDSYEGRTALLTIRADGASVRVPVQQRGVALGTLSVEADHIGNAGGRLAYFLHTDLPFTLTTEDEWLHPRLEGDSLVIDVDRNASRFLRRGVVDYECNGIGGHIDITQYDLSLILGEYYFGGNMQGAPTGFRFHLTEVDGQFYMTFFTMEDWSRSPIPIAFDPDRCILTFRSGTVIYSDDNTTYAFYFFDDNGRVVQSERATMKAELYYNPFAFESTGSHYATLEDGGTWSDAHLSGFVIYMLSSFIQTQIVQLSHPYIVRLGPIGSN